MIEVKDTVYKRLVNFVLASGVVIGTSGDQVMVDFGTSVEWVDRGICIRVGPNKFYKKMENKNEHS